MDQDSPRQAPGKRRQSHDLAYVLGQGASVGRSRVRQNALSVAPLVLLNAIFVAVIYLSLTARGVRPDWNAAAIVGSTLAALPVFISLVLVSLRDHEQPITVAVFVTGIAEAIAIAMLAAFRIFTSYSGVLATAVPTALVMIVVVLRVKQAQNERVALLDFPDAGAALRRLGGDIPVVLHGGASDLGLYDRFLIDIGTHYSDRWSQFILRAHMRGVLVTPWVQFLEMRRGRVDIASFDFSDVVISSGQIIYSRVKRAIDIVGVLISLPISLPLGVIVFVYVKLTSRGPALFTQLRRGYGGNDFTIYKFRTMELGAGDEAAALGSDRRVLPGMQLVRRLRLDELPQLYNILRGEMSIVGPRPESATLAAQYERQIPRYIDRLMVRPGLTGWAQVNAAASADVEGAQEKLAYDLYYIKRLSLDLDLLILGKTLQILAFGMKKPVSGAAK